MLAIIIAPFFACTLACVECRTYFYQQHTVSSDHSLRYALMCARFDRGVQLDNVTRLLLKLLLARGVS